MIYMDVDTALPEVPVNSVPLIDDTDFKTLETGVAYNASGMALNWHFVTKDGNYTVTAVTPTTGGDYDWAHQGQGMYSIAIPASAGASINNDTEGYGWFTGFVTGVLPFRGPTITLRPASINNALVIGSTYLGANVLQFGSSNGSFASGRPAVNTTHFNGVAATASGGQPYVQVPRLFGLAPVTGTIGITGNDTTHLHLDGLTYADDELNGLMLVILDSDASRYYVTWIRDWVNATALATVDLLPFTPQDSTDTYTILVIPEASGSGGLDAAGVRSAIGMSSANLDAQLAALPTAAEIVTELGNGSTLTEAGGTGDHLTAVAQSSAYTATRAGYLDNINNAALQTTAAQTGDSYARLGAPSGASVSADVATAQADLDILTGTDGVTLASSQPNYAPALVGSEMTLANGAITDAKIASGAFTAAKFASGAFDAVWSVATRTLTSVSGLGIATAAKLLAYVQLLMRSDAAIATDNAAELIEINADGGSGAGDYANTADANEAISDAAAAVKAKTDNLPASPAAVGSEMNLADDAITSAKYDQVSAFENQLPLTTNIVTNLGTVFDTDFSANYDATAQGWKAYVQSYYDNGTAQYASFPNNLSDMAITDTTGRVTVGTNADKTGYSLTAGTGLGNQTADINGTVATVTNLTNLPMIPTNWLTADGLATDAAQEIRNAITGGAYPLDTDANGRIRIVDGTGAGEIDTSSGQVIAASVAGNVGGNVVGSVGSVTGGINTSGGTITTLDELDNVQDSQHVFTQALLNQLVPAITLVGSTGNTTTTVNLNGLTFGDDEIVGRLLLIYDTSEDELHSRWVESWVLSTGLATVEALPFTPDIVDSWTLTTIRRQDATSLRAAVGLASANLDTQIADLPTNGELATALAAADDTVLAAVATAQADLDTITGADGALIATGAIGQAAFDTGAISSSALAASAVQAIRDAITGGSYALDTDANGRLRIVDGTGAGELDTSSGLIAGIAGTIQTLDALDTAQDTQHSTTQAAVAGLNNLSAAQVNAQVVDALATDTYALPGAVTPSATPTLAAAIMQLFQQSTNKTTQDDTTQSIYARDGSTVVQTRSVSDSGTLLTLGAVTSA